MIKESYYYYSGDLILELDLVKFKMSHRITGPAGVRGLVVHK